jgi:hypothetical protein
MPTREQLVALLRGADGAWTTVRGVARYWRRPALTDLAFERFVGDEAADDRSVVTFRAVRDDGCDGDGDGDEDPIVEATLAVAAARHGQQRRVHALSRRGEEWQADTVVVDGHTFWARTGTSVETNHGDPNYTHGGADILDLLEPGAVPTGFDLAPTDDREVVAGRPCVVAIATPRAADPDGIAAGSEAFNMIAGGQAFRLCIDTATGILLRVTKLVDDQVAEVCEFAEISIDEPLDDDLFAPLG